MHPPAAALAALTAALTAAPASRTGRVQVQVRELLCGPVNVLLRARWMLQKGGTPLCDVQATGTILQRHGGLALPHLASEPDAAAAAASGARIGKPTTTALAGHSLFRVLRAVPRDEMLRRAQPALL